MSSFYFGLKALILTFLASAIGFFVWYYTATNTIIQIATSQKPLASFNNRTNLLVMGVGGAGHDGNDLTDTIMLISLGLHTKDIKILSIPRDIWIPSLQNKINTAYHYGKAKDSQQGLTEAKKVIGDYLGVPIHYAAIIDFYGFVKLIDIVGGIDVYVERSFDDYKYPILGQENAEPESARYEHLHFDAGYTHMDGATALKFARSRHAEGEEGTDFARAKRQQKIIFALKDKILSSQTLLNLNTLRQIIANLQSSIDTDVTEDLYASFFRWGLDFASYGQKVTTGDLTPYLINPKNTKNYAGAWVLIAKDELKPYVATFLSD